MRKRLAAMLLTIAMAAGLPPLAACGSSGGGGKTAASMHLRRTEGTVSVSDGNGSILPVNDLGLYSGYGVGVGGWVEDKGGLSRAYILEGKVECSTGDQTVRVNAGEMTELRSDGQLAVESFDEQDLPAFVRGEVDDDRTGGPDKTPGPEAPDVTESHGAHGSSEARL